MFSMHSRNKPLHLKTSTCICLWVNAG